MKTPQDNNDDRQRGGRPYNEEKPTTKSEKAANRPSSINGIGKQLP